MRGSWFWVAGFLLVLVINGVFVMGYGWMINTSYFELKKIEVVGNKMVPTEEILKRCNIKTGTNIFSLNLKKLLHRIKDQSFWIDGVTIIRELPDKIVVRIKEKTPYYWMSVEGKLFYADKSGNKIAPVEKDRFVVLPFLEVDREFLDSSDVRSVTDTLLESDLPFSFFEISSVDILFDVVKIVLPKRPFVLELDRKDLAFSIYLLKILWMDLKKRGELKHTNRILIYNRHIWVKMERLQ